MPVPSGSGPPGPSAAPGRSEAADAPPRGAASASERGGQVPAFDASAHYVRLTRMRPDGFVEFEFAIGDPDLAVELIMPADAYREFCREHDVVFVTNVEAADIDRRRQRWSAPDDAG